MSGHATQKASEWVYRGLWGVLTGWFRVPREAPTLPTRAGETLDARRPSEAWLRYRKFWFWLFLAITDIFFIAVWIAVLATNLIVGIILAPLFIALIVLPDVFAFIAIHLRYDTTWYVFSPRSVRIRRGIWLLHETTITYENIQDVSVQQGPIQRHFGFANLLIKTAGGGGGSPQAGALGAHVGLIEGVHDANELRDLIMSRVRASRSAGLGDDDHDERGAGVGGGFTPAHLEVLREIAAAAKRLSA
ncbi:MAG: PH domain-containing protein [Phycisphaerales bacterium]|nr:PH domain-containing protein [Phycisphaerales bacterium]